jgi:hypothetical protein
MGGVPRGQWQGLASVDATPSLERGHDQSSSRISALLGGQITVKNAPTPYQLDNSGAHLHRMVELVRGRG